MANVCLPAVVTATARNSEDKGDLNTGTMNVPYLYSVSLLSFLTGVSQPATGLSEALLVFQCLVIIMQEHWLPDSNYFSACVAAAGGFLQPQQICVSCGTLNLAVCFVKLLWAVLCVYF